MKKDNRFVSPPGALQFTGKTAVVTEEDMKRAEKTFDTVAKQLNLTPVDDATLEIIRAKKKDQSSSPATAQH